MSTHVQSVKGTGKNVIYMNFTRCVQAQKQGNDSISKQGKEMSVFLVKKITCIYIQKIRETILTLKIPK